MIWVDMGVQTVTGLEIQEIEVMLRFIESRMKSVGSLSPPVFSQRPRVAIDVRERIMISEFIPRITIVFFLSVLMPVETIFSQPGLLWTKTFGGGNLDGGNSLHQTSDGGYIIAGYTFSYGAGLADVWLIKTDVSGDTLWMKTLGGENSERANAIHQTSDGGYIIAGYTFSYGAGAADVWLIKTDASGDTSWTKTFGGFYVDKSFSVQQTTDGGYIVAGHTESYGAGLADVWLIKTDASGDTLWTKTFGGDYTDGANSVQQTSDGGYILLAHTRSYGAGLTDIWLIKTNTSGDTLWTKTIGGEDIEEGKSIQQTSDGGYIITGYTWSYGWADLWLIKTDAEGQTLWIKTYAGGHVDVGQSVEQTSDGGYIVTGFTSSFGEGVADVWLIKTDASGDTLWTTTFGGNDDDRGLSGQQTPDGGYILTGYTASSSSGFSDVWLLRVAPDTVSIAIHDGPELYPLSFYLHQNHPNPFNPTPTIRYDLPEQAQLTLGIYDLLGKQIKTLVNQTQDAGNKTVVWDGTDEFGRSVSAGVYLYRIKAGEFIQTRKMVLLK